MTDQHGALIHDHDKHDPGEPEGRSDELAGRRARRQADPVQGFYLRHGRPVDRGAQVTAPGETGEDDDPGTA
jgi:hypothetical protein